MDSTPIMENQQKDLPGLCEHASFASKQTLKEDAKQT